MPFLFYKGRTEPNLVHLETVLGSETREHLKISLKQVKQSNKFSPRSCKCNKFAKKSGQNRFTNRLTPISVASISVFLLGIFYYVLLSFYFKNLVLRVEE